MGMPLLRSILVTSKPSGFIMRSKKHLRNPARGKEELFGQRPGDEAGKVEGLISTLVTKDL